ncbi:efflux RND transporter periplasmic adaptor subunit [Collimonas sp.]|jgi:multidrug efflux system membrane fusion protein|uniref:efflux RND transporter periplasmic adaptor subunit n=1 Tax=Collimonas sp. TaxID=1963772 RepID=UPI002D189EE7|nr:efflux RND transporter periplasmic adaptor subunit [Collimonas sp.]HWW06831.1 efflux RND transporter periplasmic adaptor subunit [Collimonas sp.]
MKSAKSWWLAGVVAAVAGLYIVGTQLGVFGQSGKKTADAEKAVPVKVVLAERKNVRSYLDSAATVQALNTVLVHARVDAQINKVLFQEGSNVKRGEVLIELDRQPFEVQLRAAQAQKQKDSAQFANTKHDLERYEFLEQRDSGTRQILDTTRALLEQQRATLSGDQAQIDMAQLQLGYTTIRTPIDGRLGARLVDAGNLVHANDTNGLVVVSQIQPIAVVFSLPQVLLPVLRQQQENQHQRQALRVMALAEDGKAVLDEGELTLIESQIDAATGTIRCKAIFKNARENLWPGAFTAVRVVLNELPDAVSVPSTAIQTGAQHPFVYVVTSKNVAEPREVTVGPVADSRTVILAGLAGGERVVVEGQFQLQAGARVEVKDAATTVSSIKSERSNLK